MEEEKDWRAEDDSRILIKYQELIDDSKRYKAALAYLKKQQLKIASALNSKKEVK